MKLLLIKIGKIWSILRREGALNGGKRVFSAGFAMFRQVRPGDVLFITGGVGDSARYRCHHVGEELGFHGFRTAITVQDNPFLPSYADTFSVFIFHRVLFTPSVAKLIDRIKATGKEIIFETDDLVYDPEYLVHMDYFTVMNPLERKLYEHGVGGEILADPYVTTCTTTTSFLADKLREHGKQVFIVPNKLSEADLAIAAAIASEARQSRKRTPGSLLLPRQDRDDTTTLAYFSGTASHNKDFATITAPLLRILDRYPEACLVIHGPLDLDPAFDRFGDRVKKVPYSSRGKHLGNVAATDINLAPLEIGNPFCESKSELKFFEAGILGVPTVASATRTFREAIEDGKDGFFAATEEEWYDKLSRLIEDPDLRSRMGVEAEKTARTVYTNRNAKNDPYYRYLVGKVTKNLDSKNS